LWASGKGLKTPPILLLSVTEVALPPTRLWPPRHPARLLRPIFLPHPRLRRDVFFYSGHPTIFPASSTSSMDSQLLRELASNSATSAHPLLSSADVQPAPRPLPLTFTIATPVLVCL
ncbi:hypothetical protein CRENBAI_023625, partial [Crenichthys baileyi]